MQVDPKADFAEEIAYSTSLKNNPNPLEEPKAKRLARGSFFQAGNSAPPEKRGPQTTGFSQWCRKNSLVLPVKNGRFASAYGVRVLEAKQEQS